MQTPLWHLSTVVQTLLSEQFVPSDLLVPWSTQTEVPVEQEVLPLWHGLAGVQTRFSVQAEQTPL